jgi:hypothetical protein
MDAGLQVAAYNARIGVVEGRNAGKEWMQAVTYNAKIGDVCLRKESRKRMDTGSGIYSIRIGDVEIIIIIIIIIICLTSMFPC